MTSSILQTSARLLMPLLLLFALFLLLRGHNQPGGGFVGGLVVAASFVLYSIAFGVGAARRALLVRPSRLLGIGLLVAFVSHPRQVLDRDRLLDMVQGREAHLFDRAVDNQVSRLRRKMEQDSRDPKLIQTVWGGGYRLAADVRRIAPES